MEVLNLYIDDGRKRDQTTDLRGIENSDAEYGLFALVDQRSESRGLSIGAAKAMIRAEDGMSTLQEIKTAIAHLNAHDKALLAAELFATNAEPDEAALEVALERGLKDVEAGRVRPVEEVKSAIPRWVSKS